MLSKYKIEIFHTGCILLLIALGILLVPFIFATHQELVRPFQSSPILQEGSKRTVWKRGKHQSTTISQEKASTIKTTDEKSHSSSGWTTIKWRKGDT